MVGKSPRAKHETLMPWCLSVCGLGLNSRQLQQDSDVDAAGVYVDANEADSLRHLEFKPFPSQNGSRRRI